MKLKDSRSIRLALGLVGVLTAAVMLMARPTHGGGTVELSVPHDWSHRYVVFSGPSNIWHAWTLQQEPRFWHQWLHRNAEALRGANSLGPGSHLSRPRHHHREDALEKDTSDGRTLKRDWAMSLTAGGTTGTEIFPAKKKSRTKSERQGSK